MRLAILLLCLSSALVYAANDEVEAETTLAPAISTIDPNTTTTTTTTSPPPPTTVPPTTPVPMPSKNKTMPAAESYVVSSNDKDNLTCVMAEFAAQFVIEYTNVNNENVTTYLDVVDAKADPANLCINKVNETKLEPQNLVVLFGANKLTLRFVQVDGYRYVDTVALSYTPDPKNFPGYPNLGPIEVTFENQTLFKVSGNKSYLCKAETTLSDGQVTVNFDSVHVDSFRVDKDNSYRQNYECQTDTDVNDMVPIAVGIALLALVVIVLIAYFIGRRRSRRLAYQSV